MLTDFDMPTANPYSTAEEEAYRHIQHAIRTGRYQANERLVPETIATEIGTSRMPVREAFRRLAAEGLVIIRPNRGVTVNQLDFGDMEEIFEMRAVLEGLAIRLAVPHITPAILKHLEGMLDELDTSAGSRPDWAASHRKFHALIYAACGRPRLVRQITNLHVMVEPYLRQWVVHHEHSARGRESHEAFLGLLRQGDAVACENEMRAHILRTVESLKAVYAAAQASARR